MKKLNAKGPEVLGKLPRVPGLPPKTFKQAIDDKAGILIDTRTMLGFGGGHIAGALNIGGTPMLSIWAGWLLDPEKPLLLVLDSDAELEKVREALSADRIHQVRWLPRRRDEGLGQCWLPSRGSRSENRS